MRRKMLEFRFALTAPLLTAYVLTAAAQAAPSDSGPQRQSPVPIATYEVHAPDALKDDFGVEFQWSLAPDNSILISFGKQNGQWVVQRLKDWKTQTSQEETIVFPFHKPERHYLSGEPIVSPSGDYLIICPGKYKKLDASGNTEWAEEIAVIDLRTFRLASLVQREGEIETDALFFDKEGVLMRISNRHQNATALSLPELKPIAECSNGDGRDQFPSRKESSNTGLPDRDSCSALLSMAHVSTLLELQRNHPDNPRSSKAVGGPDCSCEARSEKRSLELDRCGKTHFADSDDGVFNTTFWHALKVLSIPDGKTVFSLPLHFYEGTASGLFAQANDHEYLVVRRGLKLLVYLLPE